MTEEREVLTEEQHECPDSISGICALVRYVLEAPGKVEQLSIEIGEPVRVSRWVKHNDLMEDFNEPLDKILQHREMIEYMPRPGANAFEVTWCMLDRLSTERLHPVCWVIGVDSDELLNEWARLPLVPGSPRSMLTLLTIPVERLKSIPAETLILCGSDRRKAGKNDVSFSIKTTIDLRGESHAIQDHRDADSRGDHPQGDRSPARALEGLRGGHRRQGGGASSFLRERLRGSGALHPGTPRPNGEG